VRPLARRPCHTGAMLLRSHLVAPDVHFIHSTFHAIACAFFERARFSSAMPPQVLQGRFANELPDGPGVFLRDPEKRILETRPPLGSDDPVAHDLIVKPHTHSPGAAHDNGDVVLHGQKTDGLIGGGALAEEVDKQALVTGVLVGDEPENPAAAQNITGTLSRALLVEQFQPSLGTNIHQKPVEVWIVQRAHDGREWKTQRRQHKAHQFPVPIVPGDQDRSAPADEYIHRLLDTLQVDVPGPGPFVDESGRKKHLDDHHGHLLHGLPCQLFDLRIRQL